MDEANVKIWFSQTVEGVVWRKKIIKNNWSCLSHELNIWSIDFAQSAQIAQIAQSAEKCRKVPKSA